MSLVEPLIHQDKAGPWFIDWLENQGIDLKDAPLVAVEAAEACYSVFINEISCLHDLRQAFEVGKHEYIRKWNILIWTTFGTDPATLSDEEWARRSADIDYLNTLRSQLPGMLR